MHYANWIKSNFTVNRIQLESVIPMSADIKITRKDDEVVIKVFGKLDFSQLRKEDEIIEAASSSKLITVDFSECNGIDSTGLGFLLLIKNSVVELTNTQVRLVECNPVVREMLNSFGFDKIFEIT